MKKIEVTHYAEIGLQAAKRAAQKVIEQAHKEHKPMPIWDGEKVVYRIPDLPSRPDNIQ